MGKIRPILKQFIKNRNKICHIVQSETQDEPSNQHKNLSGDALWGDPLKHVSPKSANFEATFYFKHFYWIVIYKNKILTKTTANLKFF